MPAGQQCEPGRLRDLFGLGRVLLACLGLFAVGTVACAPPRCRE
ncbi:MFS transporter [Amycolatopsis sp. ATCC 39116]|nr:MFS transporter [Amycolatopsis sp. ATCC 39116]